MSIIDRDHNTTFSFFTAISFTVNYIIGTGFLTLPWAFQESGWVAGVIAVSVMTIFAIFSSFFLVETMARAEFLVEIPESKSISIVPSNFGNFSYQSISVNSPGSDFQGPSLVKGRKFEVTQLCHTFLGRRGRQFYTCMLTLYMYGTLWAYSTVFAKSLSSHLPFPVSYEDNYTIYLVLFALGVVPLTLVELNDQAYFQVTLSVLRIVMLLLMLVTIAQAEFNPDVDVFSAIPSSIIRKTTPAFHISKLYILVPIVAFATIFQHSIPNLSEPVRDKRQLTKIFSGVTQLNSIQFNSIQIT